MSNLPNCVVQGGYFQRESNLAMYTVSRNQFLVSVDGTMIRSLVFCVRVCAQHRDRAEESTVHVPENRYVGSWRGGGGEEGGIR